MKKLFCWFLGHKFKYIKSVFTESRHGIGFIDDSKITGLFKCCRCNTEAYADTWKELESKK